MLPRELKIIINLNHFWPCFNSSFVDFARKEPMGKAKTKIKIPIKIIKISCINQGINTSLNNLM